MKEARRSAVAALLGALRAHDRAVGVRGDSVLPGLRAEATRSASVTATAATATAAVASTVTATATAASLSTAVPAPAAATVTADADIDADGSPIVLPQWSVLCRTPAQVTAACAVPWLPEIVLDFLEVRVNPY